MLPARVMKSKAFLSGRVRSATSRPQEGRAIRRRFQFAPGKLTARPISKPQELKNAESILKRNRGNGHAHVTTAQHRQAKIRSLSEFLEELRNKDPQKSYKEERFGPTQSRIMPSKKDLLESFILLLSRRSLGIDGLLHDFKMLTQAETRLSYAEVFAVLNGCEILEEGGVGKARAQDALTEAFSPYMEISVGMYRAQRVKHSHGLNLIYKLDDKWSQIIKDVEKDIDGSMRSVFYKIVDGRDEMTPMTYSEFINTIYYVNEVDMGGDVDDDKDTLVNTDDYDHLMA